MKLLCLLAFAVLFFGCASTREGQTDKQSYTREETVTVTQVLAPTGEIVQLTEKTVKIVNAEEGTTSHENVTVETPKIVGTLAEVVKSGLKTAANGLVPGVGGAAVDYTWQIVTGALGLGGTGIASKIAMNAARKRKEEEEKRLEEEDKRLAAERQRNEIILSIEKAKHSMPKESWDKAKEAMASVQSSDTQRTVWDQTP